MNATVPTSLLKQAKAISPWIVDIRRHLHQCPELGYELHETAAIVQQQLESLGIELETGIAKTGVVGVIGPGHDRCVMLRADMDGLPIEELADVEFKSRHPGRMHACGHDCHMAMLLGAAKLLKEQESTLDRTVKLCFQPAEEGGAGAKRMCDEGVLENPSVEAVFGMHVWPMLPTGQLTGKPGPFLAATGDFEIVVRGTGGHAAIPQLTIDPVATAAKIVVEAQTLIAREQDPLQPAVISITAISGGTATNVIPESVMLRGTIRSLSDANRDHLKTRLAEMAASIATANRCTASLETLEIDYPCTANDPELWDSVAAIGAQIVGSENLQTCPPVMAGEDFSFYGQRVPGCFIALGTGNSEIGAGFGLHHPKFKVDEAALPIGTALHVAVAIGI